MSSEDDIDEPTTFRARRLVHLQRLASILSVLVGQCEHWGYGTVLESGVPGRFFVPVVQLLLRSAIVFPVAVLGLSRVTDTEDRWSWMAVPLSAVMSFVQLWAFLPLFS